jgi:hypothetical protein
MKTDRHEYWKERWEKEKNSGSRQDRHEYWKERWAKQKAEKETPEPVKSKSKSKKKDRHRKRYHHDYNAKHPERLERGFTKGYVNGNVSEGLKEKQPNYPGGCLQVLGDGYYIDRMGWKRHLDPLTDALLHKEQLWHDDDWDEGGPDD